MMATQPITFAGITAGNDVDQQLLDAARAEWRECVQSSIHEGDVDIVLSDFDGDLQQEELNRIRRDVAERVAHAADPGRLTGYSLKDITFDTDDVYYWASDRMWELIAARVLTHAFGHEHKHFIHERDVEYRIEGEISIPGEPERPGAYAVQLLPEGELDDGEAGYFGHTVQVCGDTYQVNWLW